MPRPVEPRPLKQRRVKTLFIRVPTWAWAMVSTGRVSEFRAAVGNVPQLGSVPLPTLAVAYRPRLKVGEYDYRLMLLEGVRREALGTIGDDGLRRAGYTGENAFARFRRDWMINEKKRFEPLRVVFVFRVRPLYDEDLVEVGLALVEHLYGEFSDARERPKSLYTKRRRLQELRDGRFDLDQQPTGVL